MQQEEDPVVLRDIKVERPPTHPKNEKFTDYLLTMTEMKASERDLLIKILDHYEETATL